LFPERGGILIDMAVEDGIKFAMGDAGDGGVGVMLNDPEDVLLAGGAVGRGGVLFAQVIAEEPGAGGEVVGSLLERGFELLGGGGSEFRSFQDFAVDVGAVGGGGGFGAERDNGEAEEKEEAAESAGGVHGWGDCTAGAGWVQ